MNRLSLFIIATVLAAAVPIMARQAPTAPAQQLPNVDKHLEALSQKLNLTAEQKNKARPILARMQDEMQEVLNDTSLTPEQTHEKIHAVQMKADQELRESLTGEQKKRLDELESNQHPDMQK
jgi:Spy/CpxP family protein refolding chaperone